MLPVPKKPRWQTESVYVTYIYNHILHFISICICSREQTCLLQLVLRLESAQVVNEIWTQGPTGGAGVFKNNVWTCASWMKLITNICIYHIYWTIWIPETSQIRATGSSGMIGLPRVKLPSMKQSKFSLGDIKGTSIPCSYRVFNASKWFSFLEKIRRQIG